jgi:hypothetical protein
MLTVGRGYPTLDTPCSKPRMVDISLLAWRMEGWSPGMLTLLKPMPREIRLGPKHLVGHKMSMAGLAPVKLD